MPEDFVVSLDCEELLVPPLALGVLADDEELGALALPEVEPLVLDWPDALPLVDGEVLLLVDGAVPPAALPEVVPELVVEPDALPEPDDWLVCAPCVMVDDGLVVVASWVAVAEPVVALAQRSEERRVGKECRSRWSPYH